MSVYHSSELELEWFKPSAGRICEKTAWQVAGSLVWLDYAASARGPWAPADASPEQRRVLSSFSAPDGSTEYIEPLTGMARHPFTPIWNCARKARAGGNNMMLRKAVLRAMPTGILNTSYLIPLNFCGKHQARGTHGGRRRSFLFDLGSSLPDDDWGAQPHRQSDGRAPKGSKADRQQRLRAATQQARHANQAAYASTSKSVSARQSTPGTSRSSVRIAQVEDGKLLTHKSSVDRSSDGGELEGIGVSSLSFFSRLCTHRLRPQPFTLTRHTLSAPTPLPRYSTCRVSTACPLIVERTVEESAWPCGAHTPMDGPPCAWPCAWACAVSYGGPILHVHRRGQLHRL